MSWYTAIFPVGEDFSHDNYASPEELKALIDDLKESKNYIWSHIAACVSMTPYADEGKNRVDTMMDLLDGYWKNYLHSDREETRLCIIKELWEDELRHERLMSENPDSLENFDWFVDDDLYDIDPESEEYKKRLEECKAAWKPSYNVNHFQYGQDPAWGVEETAKSIADIHTKLAQMVCSTPSDIVGRNEGDVLDTLSMALSSTREYLDDELFNHEFSKLCVRFWDTHKEG